MFSKKKTKKKKKTCEAFDRVYKLHNEAKFIMYIDDVFNESENAILYGIVAKGRINVNDSVEVYSCEGVIEGTITSKKLMINNNQVDFLEGGDKKASFYTENKKIPYIAGQMFIVK